MEKTPDFEANSPKKPKLDKFKDTTGRLRRGKETHLSNRAGIDWRHDRARVCDANAVPETDTVLPLEALKAALSLSRTGEALLAETQEQGVNIAYDMQTAHAQFYPRAQLVALNPHRPRGELINMLARELRRARQHAQGALVNPMAFEPDEAVLVNRAQQADAFMFSVKVAWELKLAGDSEAWNTMAGSPMAGVGRAFELRAQEDFRSLNNGEASRAAYDKFFEGNCTKAHDKRIIHQMLLDDAGYMKALHKEPRAGIDLFFRLGELPGGANYLSLRGKKMPTDTCYATVEDRSNANFLWFIKFERSFQEKEMQMIKESVKASAEIVDLAIWAARSGRSSATRGAN